MSGQSQPKYAVLFEDELREAALALQALFDRKDDHKPDGEQITRAFILAHRALYHLGLPEAPMATLLLETRPPINETAELKARKEKT